MKILATPESVKNFLEDGDLDFLKFEKFKCAQRRIIDPFMTPQKYPLLKSSECKLDANTYHFHFRK